MTLPAKPPTDFDDEEIRSDRRFRIDLPVIVNTPLSDQKGWIVDVSRRGLKVHGIIVPPRARVCVHYQGRFAEGRVRWFKPHGAVGIVLDEPLKTGPLAAVWKRFDENVKAFGKYKRLPKPVFGRKTAD